MKYFQTLFVLFISFCLISASAADKIKYTGTFSSLEYNEEGGDLLGVELRIVYTDKGYQGMLQIAEGNISTVMIVSPKFTGEKITFLIDSSETYKSTFEGVIDNEKIVGKIKFYTGGEMQLRLPRKKSYWD